MQMRDAMNVLVEASKKELPAIQYSPDGNLALVPSRSDFNPSEIWWTLKIKSPKNGNWVDVQGGTSAYWMTDLGFNPHAR